MGNDEPDELRAHLDDEGLLGQVFTWDTNCGHCGRSLLPSAHGNISASVMFRVYVCPVDARVIVRRSDGVTNVFTGEYLATMFDAKRSGDDDD